MTIINNITISDSVLKINYKGKKPDTGICSNYSDGYCGGFKSCDALSSPKAYDYNIDFTIGYGTMTTYSGADQVGACSLKALSSSCFNTNESDFVPVAVPFTWFNKSSGGNCKAGLYCDYGKNKITDSKDNELCFKLSNIDDDSKFTNVIVKDKCDGNCPSNDTCNSNCNNTPCNSSFNCYSTNSKRIVSSCYDPSTRCAIQQDCPESPSMKGINQDLVTHNNPTNLNKKYGIDSCCPTKEKQVYADWCSGFYVHFDMACGSQGVAKKSEKYSRLCKNAESGGNCGIKYERIQCPT